VSLSDDEKLARLEKALQYGGPTHRVSDVVQLINDKKAQWWSAGDGCIVTEVLTYPLFKAINYWLICGELRDCLALEEQINTAAIGHGCEVALAAGRRGWGRVAAPTGWRPHGYTFWKPLTRELWHV
jgi:hypothetical protein